MRRTLSLGLALLLGLVLTQVAAAALPPTSAHGTGFLIKSQSDLGYCINVAPGFDEGRSLNVQQCTTASRWAFPWGADGFNVMVEEQGMCVNVAGRKLNDRVPVAVTKCHYNRTEVLKMTDTGLLQFKSGGCLGIQATVNNVGVDLVACDENQKLQLWALAH